MQTLRTDRNFPFTWPSHRWSAAWLLVLGACASSESAEVVRAPLGIETQAESQSELEAARQAEHARTALALVELARSDNRVQEHLHTLTVGIGPRLSASHNLMVAERWARDRFRAWDLEAELEPWGSFPVGFDRGVSYGAIVAPELEELEFMTHAWTAGTGGPRRGAALLYPADLEALEAVREQLNGAWIVHPRWERGERPRKRVRDEIEQVFAEEGIAGNLRGASSDLLRTSGKHEIEWDALPTEVVAFVIDSQFTALEQRLRDGEELELELEIGNRFFAGPVELNNVVADIVGVELPDEYVIVCGHLDSWDGAQGAVDNGTGIATAMEAARLLSEVGARPKRTIRFILWSGEEQGLFGSRAYVEAHPELHGSVSAVLNHDGGTNYLAGLRITPEMRPQLEQACAPIFELDPEYPFELDVRDSLSGAASSDHAPFVQAGIPGFFWIQKGRSDYSFMHHTQNDVFEKAIPEYQEHSALVVALAAYGVANLDGLLERTNMSPVAPRRLGASLNELAIRSLRSGGVAEAAGVQEGDVILAVNGVELSSRNDLSRELQRGGSLVRMALQRDEAVVQVVLDYSDDPDEIERERRRMSRAERGIVLDPE